MTAADCRSPSAMWERAEPITEALWLLPLVQGDNAQTRALHARNPWQSSRVGYTPAGGCFWAIATARQVCWTAESEQAQSRAAWARAGPRDRRDLDHPSVAWPGVAVISSLPSHALLPIVQTGSDEPRPFRRHRDVRIAHILCSMLAEGGLVERDFPKRYKGKITEVLA
jgi:hypothetical protein